MAPAKKPPALLTTLCSACDKSSSSQCSGCNNAQYCSAACQKKDWKTHNLVCEAFATHEPRPGPKYFRSLLIPAGEALPRFVWAEHGNDNFSWSMRHYKDIGSFTTNDKSPQLQFWGSEDLDCNVHVFAESSTDTTVNQGVIL